MENTKDKELIIRLQEDDLRAFNVLYWRYHHKLHANIMKLLKNTEVAQDILQEVFIALWEKRHSIDPDREVLGWLFTVSYNKSINQLKKLLKESVLFEEFNEKLEVTTESKSTLRYEQFELIDKAFILLSPQKKKVFDLCKFQGKTYDEAAKELNISKYTVKEYLSGAMVNIKEYVKINSRSTSSMLYLNVVYHFFGN